MPGTQWNAIISLLLLLLLINYISSSHVERWFTVMADSRVHNSRRPALRVRSSNNASGNWLRMRRKLSRHPTHRYTHLSGLRHDPSCFCCWNKYYPLDGPERSRNLPHYFCQSRHDRGWINDLYRSRWSAYSNKESYHCRSSGKITAHRAWKKKLVLSHRRPREINRLERQFRLYWGRGTVMK